MNPIYGSVGLLWSGNWLPCQNAVEAVLNGAPITQIGSEAAECDNGPPLKAYDIRHVSKEDNPAGSKDLHRVRTRRRFKRSAVKSKASQVWSAPVEDSGPDELNRSTSHESSLSHQSEVAAAEKMNVEGQSREVESVPNPNEAADDGEIELELTLGFEPSSRSHNASPKRKSTGRLGDSFDDGACKIELGLD